MSKASSLLPVYHSVSPSFHQRRNSLAQVSDHFIKTRKFRILSATLGIFLCSLWIVANFSGTAFNINTLRRFKHNEAAIAAASVMGEGGEEGIHGLEVQVHGRIWPNGRRHGIHEIDFDDYDNDGLDNDSHILKASDSQRDTDDSFSLLPKFDETTVYYDDDFDIEPRTAVEIEVDDLVHENSVVIFGETYCPNSRRAKQILSQYDISPHPIVIDVNRRDDAEEIRQALIRFTYLDTLPSVFIDSRSIGGSEELEIMHKDGRLEELLIEAGVLNDKEHHSRLTL